MVRKFIISQFLIFFIQSINCQTVKGIIEVRGEEADLANVVLFQAGVQKFSVFTDAGGGFAIENVPVGVYSLAVHFSGYESKGIDGVKVPAKKKIKVNLKDPLGGVSCPIERLYCCQEDNPAFEYYVNWRCTINYTDSLGRRQGQWVKYCDKQKNFLSRFKDGQLMKMGYYKDGKKVGRWVYCRPKSPKKKVVTYDQGKVILRNLCTIVNYLC